MTSLFNVADTVIHPAAHSTQIRIAVAHHVVLNWSRVSVSNMSLLYLGTNSELSNASESEDVIDRDQRPRGIGAEERGSRRGGRGRGANSGRGRGGPVSKPSNSISSGKYSWRSVP